MNPRCPIYRELKKRGEEFSNLPLNLSRRSSFFNLWPFDCVDERSGEGEFVKLGLLAKLAGKVVGVG
ncbi:hypothetical protein Tco_1065109 [Tanacetum coccineum]